MQGPEEDQDWKNKDDELRISRLRQRRGRSIVHRSLEDNYGAVVVANHEALAQFLDQVFFPSFFFPPPSVSFNLSSTSRSRLSPNLYIIRSEIFIRDLSILKINRSLLFMLHSIVLFLRWEENSRI